MGSYVADEEAFRIRQLVQKINARRRDVEQDARMVRKVLRLCEEEMRRVVGAIVAMWEHARELDEQALRSLGIAPREPRHQNLPAREVLASQTGGQVSAAGFSSAIEFAFLGCSVMAGFCGCDPSLCSG